MQTSPPQFLTRKLMSVPVTITIATRDRLEAVSRAIASCLAQTHPATQVHVYFDNSDPALVETVQTRFPEIRVTLSRDSTGYIALRNRAIREAEGKYVVVIDDDAYFTSPTTVQETVEVMEADEGIWGVAMPFVEPEDCLSLSSIRDPCTAESGASLRSFVGCSHTLRKERVLSVAGYREFLLHTGEERDLAIRLWAGGGRLVMGRSAPIVHAPNQRRHTSRTRELGIRSTILFDFLNLPNWQMPAFIMVHSAKLLVYRFTWKTLLERLSHLLGAYRACWELRAYREPLPADIVRQVWQLPGHGSVGVPRDRLPEPCVRTDLRQRNVQMAGEKGKVNS